MRFDKDPLDFTVHKDMVWNDIKKQYMKHLVEFIGDADGPIEVFGNPKYPLYQNLIKTLDVKRSFDRGYKMIWAFDYIENQINPAIPLMWWGKGIRLFITCPYRTWVATWSHNHFHEIEPRRFKYLAHKHNCEIVREKHVTIKKPWYFLFTGIRPLLRTLFGRYKMGIYELRRK